jgi:hypothetical protein
MQRRLGVMDEEDYEILLETSETSTLSDVIVLNQTDSSASDAGYNIEFETPLFAFTDFDAFEIQHGTGQGQWGSLLLNSTDGSSDDGDKIIPESAEAVSNNLILDSNNDSNHLLRVGGDLLLESETGGTAFELESSICAGVLVLANERPNTVDNLLDEDNANRLVGSTTVDNTSEVFLRSSITTKLSAAINKTHNTSNGLVFLATTDTASITGDTLQLEVGSSQRGSTLLITGTADLSAEGNPQADNGDNFLLETELDVNLGQSVTINTFTEIANDNLVDETDGDNLILENPAGFHGGGKILGEDFNPESYTIIDLVRESLVNISDDNSLDTIVLEEQELGAFKQEDETTVAGTFGDDLLLEDNTGFHAGDKLILERAFIALEDSVSTGEIPFGATGKTTLEPFARPSDIFVRTIGKISLEDYDAGDNIVFDTAVDAGDDILVEDGTELDIYSSYIAAGSAIELGFSGTETFDSTRTFDLLKV